VDNIKQLIKKFIPRSILLLRRNYVQKKWEKYFKDKKTVQIFEEIYNHNLWSSNKTKKFDSGLGSHEAEVVDKYVESINKYFANKPKLDAVDLGCGDFNVGKKIRNLFNTYTACDIVSELIERNKKEYNNCNVDFKRLDFSVDEIPKGDVLFVRQVLQHLDNQTIHKFIDNLNRATFKYLVLTEHIPAKRFISNIDKPIGFGIRLGREGKKSGVVITDPPFNFRPKKEETLCEVNQMGGIIRTILYYS